MRIFWHSICFATLSVLLSGCLELTEVYTINPDGSGKVVHEAVLPITNLKIDKKIGPEIELEEEVLAELQHANGVEIWDEVSYQSKGEETFYFKGTAYFKDLSQLKFHNAGIHTTLFDIIDFSRDNGKFRLELRSSKSEEENTRSEGERREKRRPALSTAEVEQELAIQKKEIVKTKMMLAGLFSDLKIDRTFRLPGTVVHSSNFEVEPDGSVRNNFEGAKLLELITAKVDDDEWLRKQIRSGKDVDQESLPDENTVNGRLFGQKAPVVVITSKADTPLFNYEQEVVTAKSHYQNLLATLEPLKSPAPITVDAAAIGQFFVAGVRYVSFDDVNNGIQPLGYRQGYTVAVVGTLPEKALKLLPGKVATALTDTGVSLLPEEEGDQKIAWPKLGTDGRTVLLDVELTNPARGVTSLQKLSGSVGYLVSSGKFSMVDLGISQFEKGSRGGRFGAEVVEASGNSLDIYVEVAKDSIKSATIFDEQGNKVDAVFSYSWTSRYTILKFSPMSPGQHLPAQGKVHLEMLPDFKVHEIEFTLTDIPLLGR